MSKLIINDVTQEGKNRVVLDASLWVLGQKFDLRYYVRLQEDNKLRLYLIEGAGTSRTQDVLLNDETTKIIREKYKEKYKRDFVWDSKKI